MPASSDVDFLREKAARFRQLAQTCDARTAARLLEIATDMEAKAAELEARRRKP
jgi:hypothetical protein